MLTAKNVPDNKMIGLQEYVVDYITKPFDNEDLIEKTSFIMGYINDQRNSGTAE
jgi:DNA-binding response OmpR family regulator